MKPESHWNQHNIQKRWGGGGLIEFDFFAKKQTFYDQHSLLILGKNKHLSKTPP